MSNPNPTPGGPPLRALAMVLIALAIVFAGLGAMSLSNSGAEATDAAETTTETTTSSAVAQAPATTSAATPTTTTVAPTTTVVPTTTVAPTTTASTSTVDRSVPVRVLNNSLVSGLAGRTASQLTAAGWTNVSSGNYSGSNLTATTVFYGSGAGDKAAATEIAAEVGGSVVPKTGDTSPGVVVVLTGN
ncbi:LytR C-terminal domain-containing protein [Nocardia rhizosphaerae]|uniref:LytR C-terminal domain-containing protein n=1 Tax=Nocardia rhizosphaerae TaxID=1691571 RepID=A0ABV8L6Q3_9NOCA